MISFVKRPQFIQVKNDSQTQTHKRT